jgi:UDP-glucose 4-epimerase
VRVVVTGGSGFIGRAVVARLVARGDEVVSVDREQAAGLASNHVEGDLRRAEVVEEAFEHGADGLVHLAASTSVLQSVRHPSEFYDNNVGVTAMLLEAARVRGVPTVVLASTNAVVGATDEGAISETTPLRPLTPYGATKAAAEMLLSAYSSSYGIAGCSLRFTNVYGPGMYNKDSVVARLMRAARSGNAIQIYGDGEQRRDYLYVDDAVSAVELALAGDTQGPLTVGSGTSVSMNYLRRMAVAATGVDIAACHVDPRPGEMRAVVVDPTIARKTGFVAATGLEKGLGATWQEVSTRPDLWP